MSITVPSALNCGTESQSPILIKSLNEICKLAISERIVSLKISNKIAVIAPNPLTNIQGDFPKIIPKITIVPIIKKNILTICK